MSMRRRVPLFIIFVVIFLIVSFPTLGANSTNRTNSASVADDAAIAPTTAPSIADATPPVSVPAAQAATQQFALPGGGPVRLAIPAIGLNDPVITVGLTANGEMAVPSGRTRDVGWYGAGTIPGNEGSAVFDAHVFAAFANLNKLKVGDNIYVRSEDGNMLTFRVNEMRTYALADVPLGQLFGKTGGRYLNLITCAGKLTADHSTYDHRLVVYAGLVDSE